MLLKKRLLRAAVATCAALLLGHQAALASCAWYVTPSGDVGSGYNVLYGAAAIGSASAWAVGHYNNGVADQTLTELWNGSSWNVVPSPNASSGDNDLQRVVAISSHDAWAAGSFRNGSEPETLIEHWNGSRWKIVPSPNPSSSFNYLNGIAAVSADDIWAVGHFSPGAGNQTLIEHWNGASWSVIPSPNLGTDAFLTEVAANSSTDVWAVGIYYIYPGGVDQTLIEHWNGSSWSVVPSINVGTGGNDLDGVAAVSSNDVWAVGHYVDPKTNEYLTLTEHWNGSAWSVVPSPNPSNLFNFVGSVATYGPNDAWIVGGFETSTYTVATLVEHWNGIRWRVVPSPNEGTGDQELVTVGLKKAQPAYSVGGFTNATGVEQTLALIYHC